MIVREWFICGFCGRFGEVKYGRRERERDERGTSLCDGLLKIYLIN